MKSKILLPATLICLSLANSRGAAVVYESFNYGGTGGAMSGMTATGTGLTGSYSASIAGGASANYVTTGLTFSSNFMPTQNGAVTLSLTPSNNTLNEAAVLGVALNAGTLTGPVYSSYLFNVSSNSISVSTDSIGSRLSNAQTSSSSARLSMYGDSGNSADNIAVSYASATSTQTGTAGTLALTLNTTYLMLGRWDNVGVAGGGTATMWTFTSAAYDQWISLGGGLETNLDIYATGKTQRAETTQIDFNSSSFLQLTVGEGATSSTGTLTGTFDEIRYASDLASVAVPEPGTVSLLFAGMGLLLLGYRMRRKSEV